MVATLRHLPAATAQEPEGEASRERRSVRSGLAGWANNPRSIGRIRSAGVSHRSGLCPCQEYTASSCIVRRKPGINLGCSNHQDTDYCEIDKEKYYSFMILNL